MLIYQKACYHKYHPFCRLYVYKRSVLNSNCVLNNIGLNLTLKSEKCKLSMYLRSFKTKVDAYMNYIDKVKFLSMIEVLFFQLSVLEKGVFFKKVS